MGILTFSIEKYTEDMKKDKFWDADYQLDYYNVFSNGVQHWKKELS